MDPQANDEPSEARAVASQVEDRDLRRLYDYWEERRGDRAMPSRPKIDALSIPYILGHIALFDVLPGPRFKVRLQGSELSWWVRQELTGAPLEALAQPELCGLAQNRLGAVVAKRTPTHWIGDHDLDGVWRHYEALLLPLSSDGENVDVVLAAIRCRVTGGPP
jgi:hypothetical protein